MNLVERLRRLGGLSQAEFAERLGVTQPAVSLYESGRRSPNLDSFIEAASRLGHRTVLVAADFPASHDRSERFSRLLHLRVAEHFLVEPAQVRSIAATNLERFGDHMPGSYVEEWSHLLAEGNDAVLLLTLCIPDRDNTGLLSSSPFAGVISDDERLDLLQRSSVA